MKFNAANGKTAQLSFNRRPTPPAWRTNGKIVVDWAGRACVGLVATSFVGRFCPPVRGRLEWRGPLREELGRLKLTEQWALQDRDLPRSLEIRQEAIDLSTQIVTKESARHKQFGNWLLNTNNITPDDRLTKFQLEMRAPSLNAQEYDLHLPSNQVIALTRVEGPHPYILPRAPHGDGLFVRAKDIEAIKDHIDTTVSTARDSIKEEMNEKLGSLGDHIEQTRFTARPLERSTWSSHGGRPGVRSKVRPLGDESSILALPLFFPGGRPGTAQGKPYLLLLPMAWGVFTRAALVETVNLLLPWGVPIVLGAFSSSTVLKIVPRLFPELDRRYQENISIPISIILSDAAWYIYDPVDFFLAKTLNGTKRRWFAKLDQLENGTNSVSMNSFQLSAELRSFHNHF